MMSSEPFATKHWWNIIASWSVVQDWIATFNGEGRVGVLHHADCTDSVNYVIFWQWQLQQDKVVWSTDSDLLCQVRLVYLPIQRRQNLPKSCSGLKWFDWQAQAQQVRSVQSTSARDCVYVLRESARVIHPVSCDPPCLVRFPNVAFRKGSIAWVANGHSCSDFCPRPIRDLPSPISSAAFLKKKKNFF